MTYRLGILEAGQNRAELIDAHGDYTDWFDRVFNGGAGGPFTLRRYAAFESVLPAATDACDGYLITGSRFSVLDREDWMEATKAFAVEAARERPVVGICFGHQLLAEAYGGRVTPSPCEWCVGVHDYDVRAPKPWMDPPAARVSLINSNVDQVVEAPSSAEVIGTNGDVPVAMMQIGPNVLSMQPHPEVTADLMAEVYEIRRPDIGEAKTDRALNSLSGPVDSDLVAGWIANFLRR